MPVLVSSNKEPIKKVYGKSDRYRSLAHLAIQLLSERQPKRYSFNPLNDKKQNEYHDYLHLSDLYDFCPRQAYLTKKYQIVIDEFISASLRMRFLMGQAIEQYLRDRFIQKGLIHSEKPILIYDDLKIIGSPDGRLTNGRLMEIKAMDPAVFKFTKNKPRDSHKFQCEGYLWLDGSKDMVLFHATYGQAKIPFNDIPIRYNLKTGETIKAIVSTVRDAENGGKLPPRICKDEDCVRAIKCPVRRQCFDLPNPLGLIQTIAETVAYH